MCATTTSSPISAGAARAARVYSRRSSSMSPTMPGSAGSRPPLLPGDQPLIQIRYPASEFPKAHHRIQLRPARLSAFADKLDLTTYVQRNSRILAQHIFCGLRARHAAGFGRRYHDAQLDRSRHDRRAVRSDEGRREGDPDVRRRFLSRRVGQHRFQSDARHRIRTDPDAATASFPTCRTRRSRAWACSPRAIFTSPTVSR